MTRWARLLLVVPGLVPIVAHAQASGAAAEIRAARLAQNAVLATRQMDSAATFWTDDVVITASLGRVLRGKTAYRDALAADSATVYVRTPDRIEVANPWQTAWEEGRWVGRQGAQGPVVIHGKYAAQWRRVGNRWLIRSEVFVGLGCSGSGCERTLAELPQPTPGGTVASTTVSVPGQCEMPRTGPADAPGCYLAGTTQLGTLPATPLFWHLDTYATRAEAEAARGAWGLVVAAHGRTWLFTIAEAEWRPPGGRRVARVGPLPLTPGRSYAAYYLDGVVPAAARTPAHRHAGPEAWYVLEGTNCLETPDGVRTAGPGESLIVGEGPPMVLTGVGQAMRRTLTLVVHDATQPWTIPVADWTPKGSCPR